MPRFLGIDWGARRIGIALSDLEGRTAAGYCTLDTAKGDPVARSCASATTNTWRKSSWAFRCAPTPARSPNPPRREGLHRTPAGLHKIADLLRGRGLHELRRRAGPEGRRLEGGQGQQGPGRQGRRPGAPAGPSGPAARAARSHEGPGAPALVPPRSSPRLDVSRRGLLAQSLRGILEACEAFRTTRADRRGAVGGAARGLVRGARPARPRDPHRATRLGRADGAQLRRDPRRRLPDGGPLLLGRTPRAIILPHGAGRPADEDLAEVLAAFLEFQPLETNS
jgi:hypothetical protein